MNMQLGFPKVLGVFEFGSRLSPSCVQGHSLQQAQACRHMGWPHVIAGALVSPSFLSALILSFPSVCTRFNVA